MRNRVSEEVLPLQPTVGKIPFMRLGKVYNRHVFFKTVLLGCDLLFSLLAFSLAAFWLTPGIDVYGDIRHTVTIFAYTYVAIAMFGACKLYNYHVIYNPKAHLRLLVAAWGWDALIFGCILAILFVAGAATTWQGVSVTASFVLIALYVKKFAEDFITKLMTALGIALIFVGCLSWMGEANVSAFLRSLLLMPAGFLMAVVAVSTARYLIVHQLFSRVFRRLFRRQTLIVGNDEQAKTIAAHIIETGAPFWIVGVVGPSRDFGKRLPVVKQKLGEVAQLHRIMEDESVSEVIITDDTISKKSLISILDYCVMRGINLWFPPAYLPVISVKLVISKFCGLEMIRLGMQKNFWLFNKLKYSFDALATIPLFLLQLPVFLAVAAAVKATSRGPVFYRATAIGKSGRTFTMYKFRSMYENSDSSVHKDFVTQLIKGDIQNKEGNQKVLKLTEDARITPVGRFIRRYSLDELPQLINVLKGDMSLIGPRPCLPYEYEAYEEWHKKRVAIRPGISGLWQVTGRSEVSFDDMILLDLYYIYNCSLLMDLNIFLETIAVVLKKNGAY